MADSSTTFDALNALPDLTIIRLTDTTGNGEYINVSAGLIVQFEGDDGEPTDEKGVFVTGFYEPRTLNELAEVVDKGGIKWEVVS